MSRTTRTLLKVCLGSFLLLAALICKAISDILCQDVFPYPDPMYRVCLWGGWATAGLFVISGSRMIYTCRIAAKHERPALIQLWHDKRSQAVAQADELDAEEREILRQNLFTELRDIEKLLPKKLVKRIYTEAQAGKKA